jgi:ribosome-binding factor A
MSRRTQQLADIIQRILGNVIQMELKDPRVGFVTVVGVELTADLRYARVRVSIMGDEQQRADTMHGLMSARRFLRRRLAEELNYLRYVPELRLELDTSLDYSIHINQILDDIKQQEQQEQQNTHHVEPEPHSETGSE